ncbi:MAG: hypothetical protein BWY52_01032 [Chloroflexi bacterium ADurb.Bin325]|nr:MAG: hypothetical protein BWY52_01032 [Chloroflexi bacterium ADurb.Bin325]
MACSMRKDGTLRISRDLRVCGLVRMGTNSTAIRRAPAWMSVSSV